jgi:hypothetical protein
VALEQPDLRARRRLPEPGRLVRRPQRCQPAVRRERHAVDPVPVALEQPDLRARRRLLEPDHPVVRRRRYQPTVRRERYALDLVPVALELRML